MDLRVLLVALLVLALVSLRARAWSRSMVARRRARRARDGERSAHALLARHGFRVVAEQAQGTLVLAVDGAPSTHALRADFLVTRAGKRFVAEVKTGSFAPSLAHAPTRRQILEYCAAFDVDGALLVDAEAGRVMEIAHPFRARPPIAALALTLVIGLALGLALASAR